MPSIPVVIASSEENIFFIAELVRHQLGNNQGQLLAYKSYDYIDDEGNTNQCSLTHPVIQFISDDRPGHRQIDVYEPSSENQGAFGSIYPVILSIKIDRNEEPSVDNESYVIKAISVPEPTNDKPGKPSRQKRAINREQYLAKDILGTHYPAVEDSNVFYLHMNRAKGKRLSDYFHKLSTLDYLSLVIALLEQVPAQLMQELRDGKHRGKRRIHCDLKAENIHGERTSEGWIITIVDFGNAKAADANGYLGTQERTTRISCDSEMLEELLLRNPTIFNHETDLYALFIVIAELAGYQQRRFASVTQLPPCFLSLIKQSPNLNDLFTHMDMSADLKRQLIGLISQMINDNRHQRATLRQALTGFRNALVQYQSTCAAGSVQPALISPNEDIPPSSFDKLIHLTQEPLEERADGQPYANIAAHYLCSRIKEIKTLFNSLNEADKERFIKSPPQFHSRYIDDFFRFYKYIETFDAQATTRLLIRHAFIVNPISRFYIDSAAWHERFAFLINHMHLKVSMSDQQYCRSILEYKKAIHSIITMSDDAKILPLYEALHQEVCEHEAMPTSQWMQSLPELVPDLNKKYALYQRGLQLLVDTNCLLTESTVISPENTIHQALAFEINTLSRSFVQSDFSEEAIESLQLLENLISALKSLQENENAYQYPAINSPQSKYSIGAIRDLIRRTNINDIRQVNRLINTIEARALLSQIIQLLYSANECFSAKYTLVKSKYTEQLHGLLPSDDPENTVQELSTILSHIHKLSALDDYYSRFNAVLKDYNYVQEAILTLTESAAHTNTLYKYTTFLPSDYNQQRPNIQKLNSDLGALIGVTPLEQANRKQILNLFIEFLADPLGYQFEPKPKPLGQEIFWHFFARVSETQPSAPAEFTWLPDYFRY